MCVQSEMLTSKIISLVIEGYRVPLISKGCAPGAQAVACLSDREAVPHSWRRALSRGGLRACGVGVDSQWSELLFSIILHPDTLILTGQGKDFWKVTFSLFIISDVQESRFGGSKLQ